MAKKILKFIAVIITLALFAGLIYLFVYLGNENNQKNQSSQEGEQTYQEQLVVDTQNSQVYYLQGEDFNQENVVVTYYDSEGSSQNVTDFTIDYSEFDKMTLGEYTIDISYNDLTTTFTVEVLDLAGLENIILQGYSGTTSLYQSVDVLNDGNLSESYFSNEEIYIKGYTIDNDIEIIYYNDGYLYQYTPSTLTGTHTSLTIEEAYSQLLSISLDSEKSCLENFIYNFIHNLFAEIITVENVTLNYQDGFYTLDLVTDDNSSTVHYQFDEKLRVVEETIDYGNSSVARQIEYDRTCPLQSLPDNIEWN